MKDLSLKQYILFSVFLVVLFSLIGLIGFNQFINKPSLKKPVISRIEKGLLQSETTDEVVGFVVRYKIIVCI